MPALVNLECRAILELEEKIGSIEIGKNADIVLWNGDPFSTYKASKVWIDGTLLYDIDKPGLNKGDFSGICTWEKRP